MVVSDGDVGDNALYTLSLRSTDSRVAQWFRVEPTSAHGRTPVVIRVNDNNGLDFDRGITEVSFTVVAHKETSMVSIKVHLGSLVSKTFTEHPLVLYV